MAEQAVVLSWVHQRAEGECDTTTTIYSPCTKHTSSAGYANVGCIGYRARLVVAVCNSQ